MPYSPPILRSSRNPWRLFLTTSVFSTGIGLVVVILMGFGSGTAPRFPDLAEGGLTGFLINALALTGEVLLRAVPGTERHAFPIRLTSFFLGGVLGIFLGGWTSQAMGWSGMTRQDFSPTRLLFFGVFAAVIGFTYKTIESLREELRSSVEKLKDQEFAEKELQTARSLQRRLLPPAEMSGPGFAISSRNEPALFVAGDFYDVFRDARGQVCFVVGDVAGKGMAAALVMATVKAMLPLVATDRSVGHTLTELNARLLRDLEKRDFVAILFGRFDPESGDIEIANAGLPDPYVVGRSASRVESLEVPGPRLPLGMRAEIEYESVTARLEKGTRLLVLSDGLPEAPVQQGEPLGYERFEDLVAEASRCDGPWLDRLLANLRERTIQPQDDDWTVLCLEAT